LLLQGDDTGSHLGIAGAVGNQDSDPPHPVLLRACWQRPGGGRTEHGDEVAASHSITSSARASTEAGRSRPSALAVVRLSTRSNLVGCSTGISIGLAPCRILSTRSPARRNRSATLGPYDIKPPTSTYSRRLYMAGMRARSASVLMRIRLVVIIGS